MVLSKTSFPIPKRCLNARLAPNFSDPNRIHDRVLLVDEKKFYVVSSHLSIHSKYFNELFNSNLKENKQKEITLKDIKADKFENFLCALHSNEFKVTSKNLPGLMMLSGHFLCPTAWSRCVAFLKNKEEFKKFQPSDLLDWSIGNDPAELKAMIESSLILERHPVHENLLTMEKKIKFALKYELEQYKAFLEKGLWISVLEYDMESLLELAMLYNLEELKENIVLRLIRLLDNSVQNYDYVAMVFKDYYVNNLALLKDKIKKSLAHGFNLFLASRRSSMFSAVFHSDSTAEAKSIAEVFLTILFTEEKEKKKTLLAYLEIGDKFHLEFLKTTIVDYLESKLNLQSSLDDLAFILESNKRFPFLVMNKKAVQLIAEQFHGECNKLNVADQYLKVINCYSLHKVKVIVESYLIEVGKSRPASDLVDLVSLAREYKLLLLSDSIDSKLIELMKSNNGIMQVFYSLKAVFECKLPNLMATLESRFSDLLRNFDKTGEFYYLSLVQKERCRFIVRPTWIEEMEEAIITFLCMMFEKTPKTDENVLLYLKLTAKYELYCLKNDISAFLEEDFSTNGFKHIQWAFDFTLNGFKNLLERKLRAFDIHWLPTADKLAIFNGSAEVKEFALRHLFRLE